MARGWLLVLGLAAGLAQGAEVLVEAESFAQPGGWVVDPQFMDQMGSPYLLAHGLGRSVPDALTAVELPAPAVWRVWVRTFDWVARWRVPGAPGRFQVVVDNEALQATFGTVGADWHWQDGGTIALTGGRHVLRLHDLTGFEGRCDAVFLTTDQGFTPPAREPELTTWRRRLLGLPAQPEPAGEFDLVVVGGGTAGTCAALGAARLGLKTALVQDRPVLGGNNSSEVRVWLQGARNKAPWPRVGDIVAELEQARHAHYGPANVAELYEDERKLALARAEPNLTLFLEHRANGAETADGAITAVVAQAVRTGRRVRLVGRWFADCTGDAALGALALADFELQPKGRMGPCNLWNVSEADEPQSFPRCPWALDLSAKPFPGRGKGKPNVLQLGGWYWESGFDRDPIGEMEYVRDWNFRAMYGAWDALKNVDQVLPRHRLNWCAYIMGKRESRRLMGDVVLTLDDLKTARAFPDGCVPTGWHVDLHVPDKAYDKGFEGDAFISTARFTPYPMPFWVPYRCLYSRNVRNLFMAGRDISVTHEALGAVRVMRTGGCMGEIVAMAASLCRRHDTSPRGVWEQHLADLQELMRRGLGRGPRPSAAKAPPAPAWLANAGPNFARNAKVSVATSKDAALHPPALLTDGVADLADNKGRWLSSNQPPHEIELTFDQPRAVGAARVISGYADDGQVVAPLRAFTFQWLDGQTWRDIPGAGAAANADPAWSATFAPVTTTRLRLRVTGADGGIARIWELEVYGPRGIGVPPM